MAEPVTTVALLVGGTVAVLGAIGVTVSRAEQRRFKAREDSWAAFAARLGASFTPGKLGAFKRRFAAIVLERDHVVVRIACYTVSNGDSQLPFTHCRAQWAVGEGPEVHLTRKRLKQRLVEALGKRDVPLGDPLFDAHFSLRVHPEPAAWLLREAWPAAALQDLRLNFSRAELNTQARTLTFLWPGHEKDMERLERAITLLVRLAGAGLTPLSAAEGLPDTVVHWPAGPWDARSVPYAQLRRGPVEATLRYQDARWCLRGALGASWPAFSAAFDAAGEALGDWPAGFLAEGPGAWRALAGAQLSAPGPEVVLTLASPPGEEALNAGLRLLVRAARAPSEGAFR
ncbi:MAG: hypothetical protein AAF447_02065 [Myxococcota bacterium]